MAATSTRRHRPVAQLALLLFLAWHRPDGGAQAQQLKSFAGDKPAAVGMVTRRYVDPKRRNWDRTGPRPLVTAVWYPAAAVTKEEVIFGGPPDEALFTPVTVVPDAEVSRASRRYPLVLLSHGTGGSARMLLWLGHALASHGYIVAAVNHHGNTAAEDHPTPQGFRIFWERPKDLSAVLDNLLADPLFGERIDRDRIGAAGFSLGGYTVISLAGGIFSLQAFEDFCRSPRRDFTCEPQPEFPEARAKFEELKRTDAVVQAALRHASDSYEDKRIKGVFVMAPALGGGFTEAGLRPIRVPVHIVVGEGDEVAPPATNARHFASLIKGARLTVLPGAVGHYAFLAECTPHGKEVVPICRDADGVDRVAVHAEVSRLALEFFEGIWARR
jgi:predicted dienelactone hydrolase